MASMHRLHAVSSRPGVRDMSRRIWDGHLALFVVYLWDDDLRHADLTDDLCGRRVSRQQRFSSSRLVLRSIGHRASLMERQRQVQREIALLSSPMVGVISFAFSDGSIRAIVLVSSG